MKWFCNLGLVSISFLTASCGYHVTTISEPISLSVPFIMGDRNGTLTSAIIEEISKCDNIEYGGDSAPYTLSLEFISHDDDQIGYKYRTQDTSSALIKNLSPVESRQLIRVRINIISKASHQPLIDPLVIETSMDYDYVDSQSFNDLAFINAAGATTTVLNSSLGQLDAWEDAKSISTQQLYQIIAQKVARAVNFAVDMPKPLDQNKSTR